VTVARVGYATRVPRVDANTSVVNAVIDDPAQLRPLRKEIVSMLTRGGRSYGHSRAVTLVFSELATNALMHGVPPYRVIVGMQHHLTHVEVHDVGEGSVMPRASRMSDGGYGLNLVNALAARWGSNFDVEQGGKVVWADIDATREI
jgi:two-component sensor histidine kinase